RGWGAGGGSRPSGCRLAKRRDEPAESGVRLARAYVALVVAGFRRCATYRQATVAAVVTNTVFGFLRFAVLFGVLDAGGRTVAGYDEPQLATFVWAGQGLI